MFINCTNHPIDEWSDEQLASAKKWGEIKEIQFPQVSPYASSEEIALLAEKLASHILNFNPDAVLIQGEMTLCFATVCNLKKYGIHAYTATSERKAVTEKDANGNTIKTSVFKFVTFREY